MYTRIVDKLTRELNPVHLEVTDDSHKHAGHAAMKGSSVQETHFKLLVASSVFENMALIERHRLVNQILE
jgi:BolA protein